MGKVGKLSQVENCSPFDSSRLCTCKSIAQEVVSASCGVLDGKDDDLLFKKADETINIGDGSTLDKGDIAYNTDNSTISYHGLAPTQELCKFLVDNEDPRVRFLYTKNDWNSKVVAWFLENGKKQVFLHTFLRM